MEWNTDRSLGIGGVVLATVLLVLDKAGKLKGTLLLVLLALAVCLLIPILWSIPWVADSLEGSQLWARRLLMLFVLGVVWAGLSVWVTSGAPPSEKDGRILPSHQTEKQLNLSLLPHGENSPLLCLEVKNHGDAATSRATIRMVSRSDGRPFNTRPYVGQWTLMEFRRRFGNHHPQPKGDKAFIPSGDHRILEIARQSPDNGRGNPISSASLIGFGEFLQWDFEEKTSSTLPSLRLKIEFLADGIPNPIIKIYDVGPIHAYGPLAMSEVLA